MRRTNDMPIADPDALYDDEINRVTLLQQGWIATEPGALAEATPAVQPNELYNTHLRLIFYDEPIFGHYQERFDRIFAEPRYTDLAANLTYFSQLYTSNSGRIQRIAVRNERGAHRVLPALLRHDRPPEGGRGCKARQAVARRRLVIRTPCIPC